MFKLGKMMCAAIVGAAMVVALPIGFAGAQEISQSHLAAALAAAKASGATGGFDGALPLIAETIENQLIRDRPDVYEQIKTATIDAVVKMVPRRLDLDNEVARVWAKSFSEDELKDIATFFNSPAGQKYRDTGTKVVSDSFQVLSSWSDRVGSELTDKVKEALKQQNINF